MSLACVGLRTLLLSAQVLKVQLDTQTLVVVAIVVALVPALIGAMVWQTMRTYPGRWVLGNFMAVLSLLLLWLRGRIPDSLSIVLANALPMAAGIAYLQGIRQFRNLRVAWWPECTAGALGVFGVAYYRYAIDNINARILVIGTILGSIGIACGITLLKNIPHHHRTGYLITGISFTLGGLIHFMRGFYVFTYAPVQSLFDRTPVNTIFFLLVAVGALSWSLGFILLTGSRLETNEGEIIVLREKISPAARTYPSELVPEGEIREQLRKILESDIFRRSAQMERFLNLIVERTLIGRPEELKEYVLGRDVFQRGDDYDPRSDSIVRVEAQRLRRKLREYYQTQGTQDRVFIDLPAGSYVPLFRYLPSDFAPKSKKRSI